eukprot:SAG11_NODE_292_length_11180_cov_6.023825_7_plen_723_part_00
MSSYPTAEEYCRWGLSARGARHAHTLLAPPEGTTTAVVCHTFIKSRTTPPGWEHRATPSNEGGRQRYVHEYLETSTGQAQSAAPPETCSLCELLAAEPATAELTGRPTAFLSHAWKYSFSNLVAALEAFQAAQPEGEPEIIFWIDICSVDQHKVGGWPPEWWTTNFKEAIRLIGHTVMMLSPWDRPQTLTRAWCLWELHCTVEVGAAFTVCLGPDEHGALEAALLDNHGVFLSALAGIDVAKAQAGKESDRAMILAAVRATADGTSGLNARVMAQMRSWVRGVVAGMVAARREPAAADGSVRPTELASVGYLATLLHRLGDLAEARLLYDEVVAGFTERYGPTHASTLATKGELALLLQKTGELAEARRLFTEVVAGFTERYGPTHASTLANKHGLAGLLKDMGELAEARRLYREVVAVETERYGPAHAETLRTKGSLADVLTNMEEFAEARRLYDEVVAGMTEGHVETLNCKMNLAVLLNRTGDHARAMPLFEEAAAGLTAQLGAGHPHAKNATKNLVNCRMMIAQQLVRERGQFAEARQLYEELVADLTAQRGPTDIDTLICKQNLGGLLAQTGDLARALPLEEEVVAGFTAQLGLGHERTMQATRNLATTRFQYDLSDLSAKCMRELHAPQGSNPAGPELAQMAQKLKNDAERMKRMTGADLAQMAQNLNMGGAPKAEVMTRVTQMMQQMTQTLQQPASMQQFQQLHQLKQAMGQLIVG